MVQIFSFCRTHQSHLPNLIQLCPHMHVKLSHVLLVQILCPSCHYAIQGGYDMGPGNSHTKHMPPMLCQMFKLGDPFLLPGVVPPTV
jgi:hypothetical protein